MQAADEDRVFISDRKLVKLYKLFRVRAWLFSGGTVRRDDLKLLAYLGETHQEIELLRKKVPGALPAAYAVLGALALQLTIGISMVLKTFPLLLTTAHTAGAALLLLAALTLVRRVTAR